MSARDGLLGGCTKSKLARRGRTTWAPKVLFHETNLIAHPLTDMEVKKRFASMYVCCQAARTESSSRNLGGCIHKRTLEERECTWNAVHVFGEGECAE